MWLLRQLATRQRCRTKDVPCKKSGLAGVVCVCVTVSRCVVCVEPRRGLNVRHVRQTSRASWPSYAVRWEAIGVVVVVVALCHCVYRDVCVCRCLNSRPCLPSPDRTGAGAAVRDRAQYPGDRAPVHDVPPANDEVTKRGDGVAGRWGEPLGQGSVTMGIEGDRASLRWPPPPQYI